MGVRLRASFAHVFLHCPISATLIRKYPHIDDGNVFSDRGSRLHDVAASLLRQKYGIPELGLEYPVSKTEQIDINNYVQFAGQLVYDVFGGLDGVQIEVEYEVDTSPILIEGSGYVDFVAYDDKSLLIVDYKSGFVRVFPRDNPQLYIYALSVLDELNKKGIHPKQVVVAIAQPSQRNTQAFGTTVSELRSWHDLNKQAIKNAHEGVEDYVPGPQCEMCPFKGTCRAYLEYKLNQAKGVDDGN